ncbi:hypothetical protein [Mucilaginibacter gynuensis]
MTKPAQRKIYLTDVELDLTFFGVVKFIKETDAEINVTLTDVKVYEYSSSNYLYAMEEFSLKKPKAVIHIEEAS